MDSIDPLQNEILEEKPVEQPKLSQSQVKK